jgi:hypothetical protein
MKSVDTAQIFASFVIPLCIVLGFILLMTVIMTKPHLRSDRDCFYYTNKDKTYSAPFSANVDNFYYVVTSREVGTVALPVESTTIRKGICK